MTTMAQAFSTIRRQHGDINAWFSRVSDPEADRRIALAELIKRMAAHVSVEQSVFLPAIKKVAQLDHDLEQRLKDDYHELGKLLIRIERRKVNSPDLPKMVTQLEDKFRDHVRRFESLSDVESRLSADDLHDVADRLERAEAVILSHAHPHLLSLGPLSRLTTRLAARFDRARDRTVSNQP